MFGRKPSNRVLVIGLDGVPASLLGRLASDGTMPRTAKILEEGHLNTMTVSLPEISAVSWPTFMTGTNPGTHGLFGFVDLRPGTYDIRLPQFKDLRAPTIWDRLGERNLRSVVINQPSTYKARPLKGSLISGFVALDLERSIFPPSLVPRIRSMDYRIDIDTYRAREDHAYLISELDQMLDTRRKACQYLWEAEDWSYFQVVITGTDRLHHFLWDALDDVLHPYHHAFRSYYRKVDEFVGLLRDRFEQDSGRKDPRRGFYMLSDHGFTGIRQEVQLNAWLQEQGLLSYRKPRPEEIGDISPHTRAFALDPSRIYLHRRGRFPDGCVEETEVPRLKAQIINSLEKMTYNGSPVIRRVLPVEEVYSGPQTELGPDLLVLSHHGFDLKGSVQTQSLFSRTPLVGMHTWDDAFFYSPDAEGDDLSIDQLASRIESRVGSP